MMLGNQPLPKSAPGVAHGARAAKRTLLALTTAAAAFFVVAGAAQAQDCRGGFRMIKDEIPIACDAGFDESALEEAEPVASAPLYTGALGVGGGNADEIPMAARQTSMTGGKCYGGFTYRPTANESYITMPMPCQ